jgi:hypothetical protein
MKMETFPFSRPKMLSAAVFAGIVGLNPSRADVVTDWNMELMSGIRSTAQNPPRASRQMAMLHLAIYDAVNGIQRTHTPYHVSALAPVGASPAAAVSAASKTIIDSLYAGAGHVNNATVRANALIRHTADLAAIADGASKTDGVTWGTGVAQAMLSLRATDHSSDVVTYNVPPAPGIWRPTPPANAAALLPNWPIVTPFGLVSGSQIRPQIPPSLTGSAYATEWVQVRDYGSSTSTLRTADQSEIALFWADGGGTETPPGHWMRIARTVSAAQGLSLQENARLFALLGVSLADAAIACWDCKYATSYWRPVTAIREADTDNNPATTGDPAWTSFVATPPFPEHTSGHSTFSRSAATILAKFFGTDALSFTIGSDGLPGVTRTYPGFSAAADESGISRIYGGIHFQSGNIAGQACGHLLATFAWDNYLQPIGELKFTLLNKSNTAADLRFDVIPGRSYRLDASSDLSTWTQLATLTSASNSASYVDVNPPDGKRFYKASLLP